MRRFTTTAAAVATAAALVVGLTGCGAISGLIGGEDDVFSLAVGDCFDTDSLTAEPTEVETVPTVDCDELHDYEVYASVMMDDDEFPGEEDTIAQADTECLALFEGFVGTTYEEATTLDVSYLYPTTSSWALGDREILCMVYAFDPDGNLEKVSGTLRNSEG